MQQSTILFCCNCAYRRGHSTGTRLWPYIYGWSHTSKRGPRTLFHPNQFCFLRIASGTYGTSEGGTVDDTSLFTISSKCGMVCVGGLRFGKLHQPSQFQASFTPRPQQKNKSLWTKAKIVQEQHRKLATSRIRASLRLLKCCFTCQLGPGTIPIVGRYQLL